MAAVPHDPSDLQVLSPYAREVAETLARLASDIALVIDSDGVIRTVAEGRAVLPATVGGWVGRRWVDTVTADTRRKIESLLDELQASGVARPREVNHPGVDGDDMPMAWTAIRLGTEGPVVAVGRDLRAVAAIQRRFLDAQHEMELDYWQRRHADNRYRQLFQVASDAVLVLDAHTLELLDANDSARTLLELPAAAVPVPGPSLLAVLPATARAAVGELLATARTGGRASEIRVRLSPGAVPLDVSATPFRADTRHQLLVRMRRDEDHAASSPAVMRALVDTTPDGVVVTDSAGRIVLANAAFVALAQQGSEARLKGRLLAEVVDDRAGGWRELLERTRRLGLAARVPLGVRIGELDIAVEVSSTLLAEGEQEHLGLTVRSTEPVAPHASGLSIDPWPELSALRAQVGLMSLAALQSEGAEQLEREFLQTALQLSAGQVGAAARLLMIEPAELSRRLIRHGLAIQGHEGNGNGGGHGPRGGSDRGQGRGHDDGDGGDGVHGIRGADDDEPPSTLN